MDCEALYDRLWRAGSDDVLAGRHRTEEPPREGGRWPLSYVLRPERSVAARLAALGEELRIAVGPHAWYHDAEAQHFTVRALEFRRENVPADDPLLCRYIDALRESAEAASPVELVLTGLTLASNAVLVAGVPADDAAQDLRRRTLKELERQDVDPLDEPRDIWHLSLIHFTGPIADPRGLVEWVSERRRLDLGTTTAQELMLVGYRYDGRTVRPVNVATAPLTGHHHRP